MNLRFFGLNTVVACVSILAGCGDDGGSSAPPRDDIPTLSAFCSELAVTLCDVCNFDDPECVDELSSDCENNAEERSPGEYTIASGTACLNRVEQLDCEAPPMNCSGNLAVVECDDYLDGTTTETCD